MGNTTANEELRTIEKKALAFYRHYVERHGLAPTQARLAEHLGVFPTAAKHIMISLQTKGHLEKKERITGLRLTLKGKRHPL